MSRSGPKPPMYSTVGRLSGLFDHDRAGVGADEEEAGYPEVEDAGIAPLHVEREGEDRQNGRRAQESDEETQCVLEVLRLLVGDAQDHSGHEEYAEDGYDRARLHTVLPKRPRGRNKQYRDQHEYGHRELVSRIEQARADADFLEGADEQSANQRTMRATDATENGRGEERDEDDEAEFRPQLRLEAKHHARDGNEHAGYRPRPDDDAVGVDAGDPREVGVVGHRPHRLAKLRPVEEHVDRRHQDESHRQDEDLVVKDADVERQVSRLRGCRRCRSAGRSPRRSASGCARSARPPAPRWSRRRCRFPAAATGHISPGRARPALRR